MADNNHNIQPWLRTEVQKTLQEAVTSRHGSSGHLPLDDSQNLWMTIRHPGRLRVLKVCLPHFLNFRLQQGHPCLPLEPQHSERKHRAVVADDHFQVSAVFTRDAVDHFQTGVGRSFSHIKPGDVAIARECQLMLSLLGNPEDPWTLFIKSFSWIQSDSYGRTAHLPAIERDQSVQRLKNDLLRPHGVVEVESDCERHQSMDVELVSQNPLRRRLPRIDDQQIERDVSLSPDQPITESRFKYPPSQRSKYDEREQAVLELLENAERPSRSLPQQAYAGEKQNLKLRQTVRSKAYPAPLPLDQKVVLDSEDCKYSHTLS